MKMTIVGHATDKYLVAEGKILHRIVRATSSGWKYEFNQRHVEVILEEVELKSMRALSIPGVDEAKKTEEKEEPSPPLGPKAASAYRALAA